MTKTVLIVEDNELNMKLFHDLLDAHGYQTLQTRNGVEALELVGIDKLLEQRYQKLMAYGEYREA